MPSNAKGRGVLPINAATTKKPFKQTPRQPAPRLRLIIRRLPPGLTEFEFWECIGKEWTIGQGKVDWAAFKPGKISKDLAKPSRPSRAYLKVKESSYLDLLSAHVKTTVFQDAKNSTRDLCLIGPPSLEFAPYNKIPGGRARHDGRQGTIDQDLEFIDFLQSLTEPITKSAANGDSEVKPEKATTTPLVQYIKDKKASKAKEKEAAATKAGKKADSKDTKGASPAKSEQPAVVKKGTASEAEKARVAKATQDVVKAINTLSKSTANQQGKPTPTKQEPAAKDQSTPTPPTPKRERQRGDANAAARIISRDLGLTPKETRSAKSSRAVSTPVPAQSAPAPASPAAKPATAPSAPSTPTAQSQSQPPTGPRSLRNSSTPQPVSARTSSTPQASSTVSKANTKPTPQPSAGARSAFLKHANPSQGITEELLRTTFSTYGTITKCEIDKKKGLGYLDFTDTEALKKAMSASPVKIANGSVVVLENRSPYRKTSQQNAQAKGSSSAASASTSVASSPKVAQAGLASIAEAANSQPASEAPVTTVKTDLPPTPSASGIVPSTGKPNATANAPASPSTSTPSAQVASQTPPSAPRGASSGKGGGKGHPRGRGGFRGRGGHRGSAKVTGAPTTSNDGSTPSAPAPSDSENKG